MARGSKIGITGLPGAGNTPALGKGIAAASIGPAYRCGAIWA